MSLLLIALSIVLLSLSKSKHFKDCFHKPISNQQKMVFRGVGWGTLLVSLLIIEQTGLNYIYWFCQLSLVILLQAWVLAFVKNTLIKNR